MATLESLRFNNAFRRLPPAFYTPMACSPLPDAKLLHINTSVARLLGLDASELERNDLAAILSGAQAWPGTEPLAMVYAGHQFGIYNPELGDGRGMLLGQVQTSSGLWDLHLKGSGRTPYSRMGDGRAVLRSSLREYLASQAMQGLGIPTSLALCLLGSQAPVQREQRETAAQILRVAPGHLRFGHFEHFFYRGEHEPLAQLADHALEHYLPKLLEQAHPYEALLHEVVVRTADLMAAWQSVGFAHGVMNTDNMALLGYTLDYGPYAFMDSYEPGLISNHSDEGGRYAFHRQASIALWNLNALAHAFSPLMKQQALIATLQAYEPRFLTSYQHRMQNKLGLQQTLPGDEVLIADLLQWMAQSSVDYNCFFRALCDFKDSSPWAYRDELIDPAGWERWSQRYLDRLKLESTDVDARQRQMQTCNPKFVLRNYLAQRAIEAAEQGDMRETDLLIKLLSSPFDEHPGHDDYAAPPPEWGRHLDISCSS
ncbi:MAG: YdiU family protein [Pseudomonadales bacterium]|nr:YdiU family protein [Pseudomonadales bacterium]